MSDEFANDPTRQAMWKALLIKNEITPKPLPDIVRGLVAELHDPLNRARSFVGKAR